MNKFIFLLGVGLGSLLNTRPVCAQSEATLGVHYTRTENYIGIASKLGFMSKEEIDRMEMTWGGRRRAGGTPYFLAMNEEQSFYTYAEEEEGGSRWRRTEYWAFRDLNQEERKDFMELGSDTYVVNDQWVLPKWKILDQIKEVNGYICLQAETKNPIKNQVIHAWFTDEIPYSFGPEGYGGLPGLILELEINGGDAVITASQIDWDYRGEISLPKKIKGKEVTAEQGDNIISKYIEESIKAKRNPYWIIRY
jgi:GLPGLI family protein